VGAAPAAFVELSGAARRAVQVAEEVVQSALWAHRETGGPFPHGECVETSYVLREEIEFEAPDAAPVEVWGHFGMPGARYERGAIGPRGSETSCGHGWVELGDGTILDPTAGQFTAWLRARFEVAFHRWPLLVLTRRSPVRVVYVARDRMRGQWGQG